MRTLTFIGLFCSMLFFSCEEAIELEVPPQIVLETRIQAGLAPIVKIRLVDGVGNPLNSDILKQSQVSIQPRNEKKLFFDHLFATDSSSTFSTDYVIKGGETYTLLIHTPGFTDLRSVTEVPKNLSIRSDSNGDKGPHGGVLPRGEIFHLPVAFDDPIDKGNYFHMVLTIRSSEYDEEVISKPIPFVIRDQPSDVTPFNDTGWMFSDETFTNGVFTSEILISKSVVTEYAKPVVTLELRSVSVDYYNYHIQNSIPKNGTLPPHGPTGVIDNVAGGVGLFGGYSSTKTNYVLELQ